MRLTRGWKVAIAAVCAAAVAGALPAARWWAKHRRQVFAAECRAARDGRHWDELQRLSADWARREPALADPWLFLAEAAEARHDAPAIADALSHVPDGDRRVLPALVQLAQLEFGLLNRPLLGEQACLRLLRLEPRAGQAHERLIQYYALSLQREKLVKQIRAAIDAGREPPEAYVYLFLLDSLRLSNAVEMNELWLRTYPEDETFTVARAIQMPEPHDTQGAASAEEIEAARKASAGKLQLVESLLEKYPHNLELLAYRLERASIEGDVNGVADLLSRASADAERDSRFWRYKGWLHETLDELPAAEAAYQQALEIHPLDWNSWNRLAVVYRRRQKPEEVERLAALVEEARTLRIKVRKLAAAQLVTPEILAELSHYARNCRVDWLADALERRSSQQPRALSPQPGGAGL